MIALGELKEAQEGMGFLSITRDVHSIAMI
jgi:hypothetical protein